MTDSITRKKIPSWKIDKNKKKINQVRKVIKNGGNKEKNESSENDTLSTDKNS